MQKRKNRKKQKRRKYSKEKDISKEIAFPFITSTNNFRN